jgi:exonuclease VII small subunit
MRRKKRIKEVRFIEPELLQLKKVPEDVVNAERVVEKLTNKKLTPKQKASLKLKVAIKNYQKAVTRKKRADTLLEKHYKTLKRLKEKYIEFCTE